VSVGTEAGDEVALGPHPLTLAAAPGAADEAVDTAVLLSLEWAQVEGEPDFVVELIDLYAEDAPRRLNAIRGASAAGDLAALRRAAHGLRGSSASLGARSVEMLCERLERLSGPEFLREGELLLTRLGHEFARAMSVFADERRRRWKRLNEHPELAAESGAHSESG
jgi:HPt (histidine-containing phosphotransfer) domain-containing protein